MFNVYDKTGPGYPDYKPQLEAAYVGDAGVFRLVAG